MSWSNVYLFCFLFGFFFSLAALVSGHLHLHVDGSHGSCPGHGHGPMHGGHGGHSGGHSGSHPDLSPFNLGTVAAFLAWFGGTGYLATHYYRVWFLTALGVASVAGFAGAFLVFWFLSKVLMRDREELDPAAYDMIGVLGTVTASVRSGGIGEMVFSQAGIRRSSPIRSEEGSVLPAGVEVVVTRYSDGIAYVRAWDEMTRIT